MSSFRKNKKIIKSFSRDKRANDRQSFPFILEFELKREEFLRPVFIWNVFVDFHFESIMRNLMRKKCIECLQMLCFCFEIFFFIVLLSVFSKDIDTEIVSIFQL